MKTLFHHSASTRSRWVQLLVGFSIILGLTADTRAGEDSTLPIDSPLLSHRLVLARDSRPYLHIVPEGIGVYLRGVRLKQIHVEQSRRLFRPGLERTRVLSWAPAITSPQLTAREQEPVPVSEILDSVVEIGEMPSRYSILLEDGTQILVTTEIAEVKAFDSLIGSDRPVADSPTEVLLLQMNADQARQLYWLLEEGVSILY